MREILNRGSGRNREDDKIVVRKTDSTITNIDIKNILNVEIVHI